MKLLFAVAAVAALILTAGPSLARTMPNHDCSGQNDMCVKACDERAGAPGLNQRQLYDANQKCLANCEKALKSCEKRQKDTDICADEFVQCIDIPDNDKENCREAYRICKRKQ
jgi:hypothetical protein